MQIRKPFVQKKFFLGLLPTFLGKITSPQPVKCKISNFWYYLTQPTIQYPMLSMYACHLVGWWCGAVRTLTSTRVCGPCSSIGTTNRSGVRPLSSQARPTKINNCHMVLRIFRVPDFLILELSLYNVDRFPVSEDLVDSYFNPLPDDMELKL